ncbi:zinc ribbon domain-containing protein [Gottschalkia acidurici]|nr:zinc ribbon domain-containing protein [Gottschalkia acidurici]
MERRINIHSGKSGKKRVYSSKYALSTIVVCGHCGDIFQRIHWNNHGCKSIVWRCASRLDKTEVDCPARTMREEDLQNAVVQAVNKVFESKTQFTSILSRKIAVVMSQVDGGEVELINQKLEQLQKELLKLANNNQDYSILTDEIYRLRDEKEAALAKNAGFASQKQRMGEMTKFLKEQKGVLQEYDE